MANTTFFESHKCIKNATIIITVTVPGDGNAEDAEATDVLALLQEQNECVNAINKLAEKFADNRDAKTLSTLRGAWEEWFCYENLVGEVYETLGVERQDYVYSCSEPIRKEIFDLLGDSPHPGDYYVALTDLSYTLTRDYFGECDAYEDHGTKLISAEEYQAVIISTPQVSALAMEFLNAECIKESNSVRNGESMEI